MQNLSEKGYIYPSDFQFTVAPEYFDDMYLKRKEKKHIVLIDKTSLSSGLFVSESVKIGICYTIIGFEDISHSEMKLIKNFVRNHGGYLCENT